ncbi:PAS domain-containing protein [Stakelama marina]|uniref:PAS domain-containing protein n=1 Tax=Stakelama marina TaxID=2826939 RepID=UPI0024C315C9|nr:PAS domain-containing protein [Stakelama marina]
MTYFEQSSVALSIADVGDDNPLLVVNARFEELTGYSRDEVVSRNCRFLQGEADDAEARSRIRQFLRSERQPNVRTTLVNFRKDGRPFVNLLYMSKLRMGGEVACIFASQFDVSRSNAEELEAYDTKLDHALKTMSPGIDDTGAILQGSLTMIANTAATVAQARLTLESVGPNGGREVREPLI